MDLSELKSKLDRLKKSNIIESEPLELPDGTKYILSALTQKQETSVNTYSMEFDGQPFVDAVRKETIANSIVEIHFTDGVKLNLRSIPEIPTGEQIEGVPVKVQKNVYLRSIIESWPEECIDALYRKILELKYKILTEVERRVKLESGPQMRKARMESLSQSLKDLVNESVESGQTDIPMTFDFRPDSVKRAQAEAETKPSAPIPDVEPLPRQIEPSLSDTEKQLRQQTLENIPEAEKQLLQEEQEESWDPQPLRQPNR